ncbi:TIGR00282 family metallophosphoesterase [Bacillus paralicheniformis]|uniref:TIGR00282 family metallophosphoesterase n=1 Tax=Bacillus paralicheniformis TaxID=1648923 RepID=UPI000BA677D1|nr:TIGR00282 family metallophosphoesterase [Bacillus paralicheniformis]MBC8622701.1 TIGR00282 family metallophosphoesterase [Robertmurraya crescens]MBR8662079.1 TIGR00282 family metallophosphoesterase [Bacillus paralicheniformis]MCJ8224398.1 TIGR00282 family metallophosphoesterase [Bacillus paralicheniformis]PAC99842.1 TIGR00282 family metallophosphoesterase [Bacillus paralicheniformis]RZV63281.1 TIGR00282 family metallophosphoesterase [Bacillus paralicheniformis]
MRILFIGDVVGSPGRDMIKTYLPKLKMKYKPNAVIVNGENAAHGKGITEKIYHQLIQAGADVLTMGNHTWDKREIFDFIDDAPQIVRPANFPEGTPGKGITYIKTNGSKELAVINLQGRTFLPAIDCPFRKADKLIEEASKRTPFIFIDFHAEATSEKQAIGWYTDGRVSAVVGTHTHVQTADNRILPKGTAYITDVGMTGPYDGILGVDRETIIKRFKTSLPVRFEIAEGRTTLSGVVIDIDEQSKKAVKIDRILINDDHMFFE